MKTEIKAKRTKTRPTRNLQLLYIPETWQNLPKRKTENVGVPLRKLTRTADLDRAKWKNVMNMQRRQVRSYNHMHLNGKRPEK